MESINGRLDKLEEEFQELRCQVHTLEKSRASDHKVLRKLQVMFQSMNKSVQNALEMLLPKVDALLESCSLEVKAYAEREELEGEGILEAAARGDADSLAGALEAGACESARSRHGDQPLHLAATAGHERCVLLLLGSGADANAVGRRMRTPLHCAAAAGHTRVLRRLLRVGATVDTKDVDGDTPLLLAARRGHLATTAELLRSHASLSVKDRGGDTPLLAAARSARWDVFELLSDTGSALDERDAQGNAALVLAARAGHWDAVHRLLRKGALYRVYNGEENSPLLLATRADQVDVVKQMLAMSDKPSSEELKEALARVTQAPVAWAFEETCRGVLCGPVGQAAMRRAAQYGHVAALQVLLDAGVDVNSVNESNGGSALLFASACDQADCVKTLLERGAAVDAKNRNGDTPLHYASKNGREQIVRLLLEAGANASMRDNDEKTPADLALTDPVRQLLHGPCCLNVSLSK